MNKTRLVKKLRIYLKNYMNNSGWKYLKINNCAEVVGGGTPSTKNNEYWDGEIPWITPKDLSKNSSKYIFKGERNITKVGLKNSSAKILPINSLLFSSRAPIGYLAINKEPLTTNQGFKSLILKKEFDVEFFYYLFKDRAEYIKSFASGSTFQEVSGSVVKNLSFLIPDIKEQKNISNILSKIDQKIEINKKINQTLEEIAKTLFKSWFIDFEPVKAKLKGAPTGLSKKIGDLFPNSFEDSELGKIPKGWKISKIGKSLKVILGGTPSRKISNYWNGTIPWINSGKINNFRIISPSEFITQEGYNNSSTKMLPKRSTLIAITGATLGQVSINEIDICANQSVIGIPPSDIVPSEFVYLWIKTSINKLISSQTGGAQQHINKNNVEEHLILIPSSKCNIMFQGIIKPMFDKISINSFENKTLISLRDTILPKLISGELKILDAEKFNEQVSA